MMHSSEVAREGRCLCGAVRYVARGEPRNVEYCHCSMCRRAAGAPTVAWADYLAAAVEWSGEARAVYASSPGSERGFCGRCGSALTYQALAARHKISITVGTLDDAAGVAPQLHIYEADRLPWLDIRDELPRYRQSPHDEE